MKAFLALVAAVAVAALASGNYTAEAPIDYGWSPPTVSEERQAEADQTLRAKAPHFFQE